MPNLIWRRQNRNVGLDTAVTWGGVWLDLVISEELDAMLHSLVNIFERDVGYDMSDRLASDFATLGELVRGLPHGPGECYEVAWRPTANGMYF